MSRARRRKREAGCKPGGSGHPEFLSELSHGELIALADSVSEEIGEPVLREDSRDRALEQELADDLDADWSDDYESAAVEALADLPEELATVAEVEAVLDKVGRDLDQRNTSRTEKILFASLTTMALLSRRRTKENVRTGNPARNQPGNPKASARISANLSQADKGAIEATTRQQLWWIGDLWGKHLSKTILETVRREALTRGLGRKDVGEIMQGVINAKVPAVSVPETWRGSKESYFEMLSGTVRARMSTSSALRSLREGGFKRYLFEAVMDERTSEMCRELDGRVFEVEDGIALMDRVESAEDPNTVKEIAGWKTGEEIRNIIGDRSGEDASRALKDAGIIWPPLHARCRSVIVPD
jgi:hypothetical protein